MAVERSPRACCKLTALFPDDHRAALVLHRLVEAHGGEKVSFSFIAVSQEGIEAAQADIGIGHDHAGPGPGRHHLPSSNSFL